MTFDEIIEYNIDDLIFTMKKKNDYYIIQCNKNLDWIESINIYSVNKKPPCD
jgi:hypothetical protein